MVDWKALGLIGAAAAAGWLLLAKKSEGSPQTQQDGNASGGGGFGGSTASPVDTNNATGTPTPKATGVEMNYAKSVGGAYQWTPGTYTAPSGSFSTVTNVTDTPSFLRQGWQVVSHPGGKDTYVYNDGKISYNYTKEQYDAYIRKATAQYTAKGTGQVITAPVSSVSGKMSGNKEAISALREASRAAGGSGGVKKMGGKWVAV